MIVLVAETSGHDHGAGSTGLPMTASALQETKGRTGDLLIDAKLSLIRARSSFERTLMSWVRTAVSLITFTDVFLLR